MQRYHIQSRWPKRANWRTVYALPHGEQWSYNALRQLEFESYEDAVFAAHKMNLRNESEFRVVYA